jgi:NADPH:quinone reductase-like Zn-dependent oxidoreductase
VFKEKAIPKATGGDVLIQVKAVSLNPIDWKRASGAGGQILTPNPMCDLSGIVVAKGPSANGPLKVGDEVVTCTYPKQGALAEYVLAKESQVGPKPTAWEHTQAAALPMGALTAKHLLSLAGLASGKKLVLIGASGGIGQMVLALARPTGASVLAVASKAKHDVVRSIGGPNVKVCDYSTEDWVAACKEEGKPDVVIDVSSQSPFWSYHKASMARAKRFITPNALDPSFNCCCGRTGPLCPVAEVLWCSYTTLCSLNVCCCPFYCCSGMCVFPAALSNAGDVFGALAQQADSGELPANPLQIQTFPPQQVHMAYDLAQKKPGSKPVIDLSAGL